MPLINDKKTLQEYYRVYRGIMARTIDYSKNDVSADIKLLYEREKPISLSDLSHDLVKELLVFYAENLTGSFTIDENNKNVIDQVVQYLRKDESFLKCNPAFSFEKGLLLHGPVGSGKTVLFKAIKDLISRQDYFCVWKECVKETTMPGRFKIISANDIVRRYSIDGNLIFLKGEYDRKLPYVELITDPLCLDDFGSESAAVHFGAKTNILAEVLLDRYEHKSLTHISTNLGVNSIKDVYDLRVFDRMREMFNDIPLTGNSRRK